MTDVLDIAKQLLYNNKGISLILASCSEDYNKQETSGKLALLKI